MVGGRGVRFAWLVARVAILAALVLSVSVITPTKVLAATTTTIGFDDLSPGTTVSTQYAAQGVDFATGIVNNNVYCYPVIQAVASGMAQSGTQVADASCANGEFPDSSIRGDLSNSAQNVSVYAGFSPSSTPPTTASVTLTAYDISGAVVNTATQTVTAGAGTHTQLSVSSSSPNVVAFDVTSTQANVSIDDLTFDNPSGVPADFSLNSQTTVLYPVQGSSTTDTVVIHRLNGSNGAIAFSASGLPTGVQATFSPNPATGTTASTTMTLSADATAPPPPSGVYPTITITGTPADAGVGPAPRTATLQVDVGQLFSIFVPPAIKVPPCSTLQIPVTVNAAAGFSGTVTLTANNVPADDQASFSPQTLTEPGQTHTTLTLTSQSDLSGASGDVSITAAGGGVTDTSGPFTVSRVPPSITDIADSSNNPLHSGQTPQGASPDLGTVVIIHGQGFCPGSTVYFGNELATSIQQGPFTDGLGPYGDETAIRTSVPVLATSGEVYVVPPQLGRAQPLIGAGSPAAIAPGTASAPFTIDSYRDTDGFSFDNGSTFQNKVGGYSFSDVSDVFGYDQTHVSVNVCWPWSCPVSTPVPNPLALVFWGIANEALRDGQCFGFSLASQRFLHGDQIFPAFPSQPGATQETVWNLQGPDASSGPSSGLMHYIHLIHMQQWSSEGLRAWLVGALENAVAGSESFIMHEVTEALNAGDHPLIELRSGSSGHVVVAYGVDQDSGNIDYRSGDGVIDIYNPNAEFTTSENAITGTTHQTAVANSEIIVHPNGSWQFRGFSPEWHGGPGSLVVIPYGTVPVHPTLPASITGLFDVLFGGARATQVTAADGHTLLDPNGRLNTNRKTTIADATQFATLSDSNTSKPGPGIFLFGHDGAYTTTVAGTASGTYHDVLFSHGTSASLTAAATPSIKDTISVPANMDGLAFGQTAGPASRTRAATVQLVESASDGSKRTATIVTTVPKKGKTSTTFDPAHNAVAVTAGGQPTSYTLTLSWAGPHGFPQTFAAPTVHLGAGAHATFAPRDWSALETSKLTVHILDAHGHATTRTLKNKLRATGRYTVALKVVKAGATRRLTIAARFIHSAHGSSAVLTWMALKGRTLAARHTIVIAAAKLHRGLLTRSFSFTPRKSASYKLRASVELLSPDHGGTYTSQDVTRIARLRG
jgi:hypothetical protein